MQKKETRITFLGHSSVLVSFGNTHILADPNLSRRIALIIRRRNAPPVEPTALPPIDLVLISHGHYDHLDLPTIRRLPGCPTLIVPAGLERAVKSTAKGDVLTLRR